MSSQRLESLHRNVPLYETSAGEAILPIICHVCGMQGSRRVNYFYKIPTFAGKIAGIKKSMEIKEGPISWFGDHSECYGNIFLKR